MEQQHSQLGMDTCQDKLWCMMRSMPGGSHPAQEPSACTHSIHLSTTNHNSPQLTTTSQCPCPLKVVYERCMFSSQRLGSKQKQTQRIER